MIAGVDEVGLGCLAGPVIASAIILSGRGSERTYKDSKKTSEKQRAENYFFLRRNCYFGIGIASPLEVDQYNVLKASHLAMIRAVHSLPVKPSKIFIDGKYVPEGLKNAESVIKGDQLVQEISAASIFAKYYRDSLMAAYHLQLPNYNFKKNKGYPTLEHKDAISAYGLSKIHRKSFKI